jgi:hypothetical protein
LATRRQPWLEKAKRKGIAEYAARHRKTLATMPNIPGVIDLLMNEDNTLPEWGRKRDAGTEAHDVIDTLAKGDVPQLSKDPEHVSNWALRHWNDFLEDTDFEVIDTEQTVVSDRWGYGGSYDLLGRLPDGRVCRVDVKTNQWGPKPDTGLQLEFYDGEHAEWVLNCETGERRENVKADAHYVLWIRPNGYAWVPLLKGPEVWRECYARLLTYNFSLADRIIGEPEAGELQLLKPWYS